MIFQRSRPDWKGRLACVFFLFGRVFAWLCFSCGLRLGHVSEDDYVRMTQEIVEQSLPKDAVPAGWERSVRETREVQP